MSKEGLIRKGAIAELEEQLEEASRRLKAIAESITTALWSMDGRHLDTDGAAVKQFGAEYFASQKEANRLRARLEELKSS